MTDSNTTPVPSAIPPREARTLPRSSLCRCSRPSLRPTVPRAPSLTVVSKLMRARQAMALSSPTAMEPSRLPAPRSIPPPSLTANKPTRPSPCRCMPSMRLPRATAVRPSLRFAGALVACVLAFGVWGIGGRDDSGRFYSGASNSCHRSLHRRDDGHRAQRGSDVGRGPCPRSACPLWPPSRCTPRLLRMTR